MPAKMIWPLRDGRARAHYRGIIVPLDPQKRAYKMAGGPPLRFL